MTGPTSHQEQAILLCSLVVGDLAFSEQGTSYLAHHYGTYHHHIDQGASVHPLVTLLPPAPWPNSPHRAYHHHHHRRVVA